MLFSKYTSSFQGLKGKVLSLQSGIVILAGVICLMAYDRMNVHPIVTITPYTLGTDAQVARSSASQSYIEAWGLAMAELLGNVTPANIDFIKDRIGPLLAPKIYHQVMDAIGSNAQDLKEDRVVTRFEPRRVIFEKSTGRVYVLGDSFVRSANSLEAEIRNVRTFEFEIRIANYAPRITFIDNYAGPPHTVGEELRQEGRLLHKDVKKSEERKESIFHPIPKADLQEKPVSTSIQEGKKK